MSEAQLARLVGGPAHGRIYAVEPGQSHLVTVAVEDDRPFLHTYDPLESLVDPWAIVESVTFAQHRYDRRHYVQAAMHPCVRGIGLVRHRYPWLHAQLDAEDPLVHSWVLSEPVDRQEWLVAREFGRWSVSRDVAEWLAWTPRPRHLIVPRREGPTACAPSRPPTTD